MSSRRRTVQFSNTTKERDVRHLVLVKVNIALSRKVLADNPSPGEMDHDLQGSR